MNIQLIESSTRGILGSRIKAMNIRQKIIQYIDMGEKIIEIDFQGTTPSHSFLDELIGVMISERGIEILSHIKFLNVSNGDRKILKYIASTHARSFV